MSSMTESLDLEARTRAVRALEGEVGELINQFRLILAANAERLSPGLLPGAYKVFTTIVRRETVGPSWVWSAVASKPMTRRRPHTWMRCRRSTG